MCIYTPVSTFTSTISPNQRHVKGQKLPWHREDPPFFTLEFPSPTYLTLEIHKFYFVSENYLYKSLKLS